MIWEVLNTLCIEIQFRKRVFFLRKGKELERQAGVAGDRDCQLGRGLNLPGHRHRRLHGQVGGHDLRDDHRLAAGEEEEGKKLFTSSSKIKSPKSKVSPGSPPAQKRPLPRQDFKRPVTPSLPCPW